MPRNPKRKTYSPNASPIAQKKQKVKSPTTNSATDKSIKPKDPNLHLIKIESFKTFREQFDNLQHIIETQPFMYVVYAEWCPHCHILHDTLINDIRLKGKKAYVITIENDIHQHLQKNHNDYILSKLSGDITGFPHVVSVKDAKKGRVQPYVGSRSKHELEAELTNLHI